MSTDTVTLAQLTDLHLGPMRLPPPFQMTPKRLLGMANWYRSRRLQHLRIVANRLAADVVAQRPAHIAVTGDLTNIGLPSEIRRAGRWLERLGPPSSVSVIPGNHDIYSSINWRNIGAAALAPWGAYMAGDAEGTRYTQSGELFPFVRVLQHGRTRVALIGLNSAIETKPFYAIGTVGVAQRQRLARVLEATREDGLVRVVMLHHAPLPGTARVRHELTDAAELSNVLSKHGADLVIHGHIHRHSVKRLAGGDASIPVVCAASASIGRQSSHGDDLAQSHLFGITAGEGGRRAQIKLVTRGLAAPNGTIVELNRVDL